MRPCRRDATAPDALEDFSRSASVTGRVCEPGDPRDPGEVLRVWGLVVRVVGFEVAPFLLIKMFKSLNYLTSANNAVVRPCSCILPSCTHILSRFEI